MERTENGTKPLKTDQALKKAAEMKYQDQEYLLRSKEAAYYSKKKPKKCIGQPSAVSPLYENACVEIQEPVVSKRQEDIVGNQLMSIQIEKQK